MINMKNIIKILPALLLIVAVTSCKKDENKVYFVGGNAPVVTASSTAPLVLLRANENDKAIKFSWTNPNYMFSNGISSQDVTYIFEVDTTGANFKSQFKQEVAISKNLEVTFTVKELNTILTKLNVQENILHHIEFRIKAALNNGSNVPLFSNVLKTDITPYLDVAVPIPPTGELYITGDGTASGWTNTPPANQKLNKVSNTEYNITTNFTPGFFYKFLSTQAFWQPQYGGKSATGGDLGYNMGGGSDPDAIPTPAEAGTYKVTLNFKTGKYTVEKQ
jgi:starch-binding outer membrane protein SusE/F